MVLRLEDQADTDLTDPNQAAPFSNSANLGSKQAGTQGGGPGHRTGTLSAESLVVRVLVHGRVCSKHGRTSAPRWPHARQVKRGSRSDRRTSSGHWLLPACGGRAIPKPIQEACNVTRKSVRAGSNFGPYRAPIDEGSKRKTLSGDETGLLSRRRLGDSGRVTPLAQFQN